jgi:hypothetical protein
MSNAPHTMDSVQYSVRVYVSIVCVLYVFIFICGGGLEYLHRSPASRRRRRKGNLGVWGYNWATLSLGDINTEPWPSGLGVGRKADDLVL